MIKKHIFIVVALIFSSNILAKDFLNLGVGGLRTDYSFDFANSSINADFKLDDTNDVALLGMGFARLTDLTYSTINLYIPKTEGNSSHLIGELSLHFLLTENIYSGGSFGLQEYYEVNDQAAQSIGASKSKISLRGPTAAISVGALLLDGALDLNFKYRFFNGFPETVNGSASGVDYSGYVKFKNSLQFTIGYNHPLYFF